MQYLMWYSSVFASIIQKRGKHILNQNFITFTGSKCGKLFLK